jgi:quercetin dioxygenase-like cupin family protein
MWAESLKAKILSARLVPIFQIGSILPNMSLHPFRIFGLVFALASVFPLQAAPESTPYNGDVKVTTLLRASTNSAGQTIEYPHDGKAEISILQIEIAPGKQTGWHKHPVPLFGYVLSGEITVTLANGNKHTFHQGDGFAECVNMLHNGVNKGAEPTKLLVFVAGEKDVPFTIKAAR